LVTLQQQSTVADSVQMQQQSLIRYCGLLSTYVRPSNSSAFRPSLHEEIDFLAQHYAKTQRQQQ